MYVSDDLVKLKSKLKCSSCEPDDIIHDVFADLYCIPEERILDLHNREKLKFYIATCIWNRANKKERVILTSIEGYDGVESDAVDFEKVDIDRLIYSNPKTKEERDTNVFYRTVVDCYGDTGSIHHVAHELKISVGTIHTHLKKARQLVKKSLA